jgi:hypothetical protein
VNSQVSPFEEFGTEISQAVEGLVYLGRLEKEVEFCGHTFGLKTLTAHEELAAASAVQEYRGTLREPEAWVTAQIAVALTHVDGDENFCPSIGPDLTGYAKARFKFVSESWYWPTVEYLFGEYTTLLEKQVKAVRAVQDLSSRSLPSLSPSADSYNGPGILLVETDSDTPPSLD